MVVPTRSTPYNSAIAQATGPATCRDRTAVTVLAPLNHQTIIVLDFGSQFTQLIARRLRELSVYSEILPFDTPLEDIARKRPVGLILSGGPKSVSEAGAPHCDVGVFDAGVPVLGICYGMQFMTYALGGEVAPAPHREFGHATIAVSPGAPLFASIPDEPAGVGEPRRLREGGAGRVRGDRDERQRASGGDGSARARTLRAAVPSGGRAHGPRPRHPAQLRVRRLRLHRRLDDVVLRRGSDRAHPCAGRRGARRLRPERRRRLHRRGDARAPRDRRSADVHLRRQRRAAARRSRADPRTLRAAASCRSSSPMRRELFLERLAGVDRSGDRSARSSARVHRRLRGGSEEARRVRLPRAGHALSRRHRERLGDRAVARHQEPPQRRRPAGAHAASSSSSRCASCSRTKCARSGRSSGSRTSSSGASRSLGPGSRCGSSAR